MQQTDVVKLKNAAHMIDMRRDEKCSDLLERLNSNANGYYHYQNPRFAAHHCIHIPEPILQQRTQLELKSFVGLLPEIGRAYMTVDNRLYLWNYNDLSDFAEFNELDQYIVSVAVLPPRRDVFKAQVAFVLAIATTVQVMLLPIVFSDVAKGVRGAMELHSCRDYAISTDNISMLKMVGTESGRLFMCGEDGNVYEFDYQLAHGWFSSKTRKVNHTASPLRLLWPVALLGGSTNDDAITHLEYDSSRHYLWTLSMTGSLHGYLVADNSQTLVELGSHDSLMRAAAASFGGVSIPGDWAIDQIQPTASSSASGVGVAQHRIVSIAPLNKFDSAIVVLVAVTNHAHRIFLSLTPGVGSGITVRFVRLCPPSIESSGQVAVHYPQFVHNTSPSCVSRAYCTPSLCLLADTRSAGAGGVCTTLVSLTRETFSSYSSTSSTNVGNTTAVSASLGVIEPAFVTRTAEMLVENVQAIRLESGGNGRLEDICELPRSFYMSPLAECLFAKNCEQPLLGLSDFAVQHALAPRRYLLLTATSLLVYTRIRPVDELCNELMQWKRTGNNRILDTFFERYGDVEGEAMCLLLCCVDAMSGSVAPSLLRTTNPQTLTSPLPIAAPVITATLAQPKSAFSATAVFVTPDVFSPAAVVTRSAGLFSPAPSVTHTTPHSLLKRSSSALSRNTPMSLTLTPAPIVPLATAAASGCAPSTVQFVRDLAARAYFEYGGIPSVSTSFAQSSTVFSAKLQALYLVFTRLVRPFWEWSITTSQPAAAGTPPVDNFTQPSPQTLRFSLGQLVAMRTPLESLQRFVSDRTFLSRYDVWPHASATISAATKTALEAELTSLQDFQLLLLRTVEALSLMILLARQASVTMPAPAPLMTTLFAKMTSPCQNRLRTLEFHQLVEASDNYDLVLEVCREMIEATINDETISQDFIVELNNACPVFFGQPELMFFQALQHLSDAADVFGRPELRHEANGKAVKLFASLSTLSGFDLITVSRRCWSVHCYAPVIQLAVNRLTAQQQRITAIITTGDPLSVISAQCIRVCLDTLALLKLGSHPDDIQPTHSLTSGTTSAVSVSAMSALPFTTQERENEWDNCVFVLIRCQLTELRWSFFNWLLEQKLNQDLYQIVESDVDAFLASDSRFCRELIAFLGFNKRFAEAAAQCRRLAQTESVGFSLTERINFLVEAKLCASAASLQGGEIKQLEKAVQDATLQREIHDSIRHSLDAFIANVNGSSVASASLNPEQLTSVLVTLNGGLLTLEQLFELSTRLNLFENALSVIAQIDNPRSKSDYIPILWSNIIAREIMQCPNSDQWVERVATIFMNLRAMVTSDVMFPMHHIVSKLEKFNMDNRRVPDSSFVPKLMLEIGVPIEGLIPVYLQMVRSMSSCDERLRLHLLAASAHLLQQYALISATLTVSRQVLDQMSELLLSGTQELARILQQGSSLAKRELQQMFVTLQSELRKIRM